MVSREHVRRVAAVALDLATARRVRVAAQLLLAAGLVFVGLRLHSIWHDSHVAISHAAFLPLIGAAALSICAVAASAFIWLAILSWLGAMPRAWWVGMFFQAQLAKYIPGSLWQYAGRTALARARGIPLRPVAVSLPVEFVGSGFGAVLFSILLAGWWGALAIPAVAIAVLAMARRTRRDRRPYSSSNAVMRAIPLYIAAWPLTGLSFWLIGRALLAVPASDIAFYVGAFAAAWLAGVLAVFAPGGLGVREGVLVAILHGRIGSADAVVLATASRALLAAVDVTMAGAGTFLLRRSREPVQVSAVLTPPTRSR